MRKLIIFAIALLHISAFDAAGQKTYELTIPAQLPQVKEGHLQMGGKSSDGRSVEVNNYYMSIDGKPVLPVMGEFHYSRYPAEQWEEEILKIKAGGVTILPTYVFWSIHEEKEGVFNWTGNRNLRKFIEICKKCDMPVIIRIGPFCHGEIRNGGLPDWLFTKPVDVRSNDPGYLAYVDRLYGEIAKQMEGLYFKDGGPVIGCQIENEHQHSAAPWGITYVGEEPDHTSATYDAQITMVGVGVQNSQITTAELGELHMKTLKDIAVSHGIVTPFYTATGWGNAAVIGNEAIPVTAAYTYPFWSDPEMSEFCMFKDIHSQPDYAPVRYNTDDFPSFCAEMGVGIQMTYSRRPIVPGKSAEALMVRTLGSGSNGIGYYMYHGGSTPKREGSEAFFSDEPMGMPKISYDFQAPLGEFGLEGTMYRNLRILHSFLNDFGDRLALMPTVLPEGWEKMTPDNRDDLRWAVRSDGRSGFVFMVNFQDHDNNRHDMKNLKLRINLGKETINIPSAGGFTLSKDESVILPFNLDMDGAMLKYATAQLLMKVNDNGTPHYFFFAPTGMETEYFFEGRSPIKVKNPGLNSTFRVRSSTGRSVKVTTLSREQALDAAKVGNRLLITKAQIIPDADAPVLLSLGENEVEYAVCPSKAGLVWQKASVEKVNPDFSVKQYSSRRLTVHFPTSASGQVAEYFLYVDYTGDVAMSFLENGLVGDHFWHGKPWVIGLNRFNSRMKDEDLGFYFRPLSPGVPYMVDIPQESRPAEWSTGQESPVCRVNEVKVIPQYKIPLVF